MMISNKTVMNTATMIPAISPPVGSGVVGSVGVSVGCKVGSGVVGSVGVSVGCKVGSGVVGSVGSVVKNNDT